MHKYKSTLQKTFIKQTLREHITICSTYNPYTNNNHTVKQFIKQDAMLYKVIV